MNSERDSQGRYDFSNLALICTCGHSLGVHCAGRPRDCMNEDVGDGEPCNCPNFKKAKKQPKED